MSHPVRVASKGGLFRPLHVPCRPTWVVIENPYKTLSKSTFCRNREQRNGTSDPLLLEPVLPPTQKLIGRVLNCDRNLSQKLIGRVLNCDRNLSQKLIGRVLNSGRDQGWHTSSSQAHQHRSASGPLTPTASPITGEAPRYRKR